MASKLTQEQRERLAEIADLWEDEKYRHVTAPVLRALLADSEALERAELERDEARCVLDAMRTLHADFHASQVALAAAERERDALREQVARLREALVGLIGCEDTDEALERVRLGIVTFAHTAPDDGAVAAALNAIAALRSTAPEGEREGE